MQLIMRLCIIIGLVIVELYIAIVVDILSHLVVGAGIVQRIASYQIQIYTIPGQVCFLLSSECDEFKDGIITQICTREIIGMHVDRCPVDISVGSNCGVPSVYGEMVPDKSCSRFQCVAVGIERTV
ncbi:hypothetical protein SDC9_211548 [bioreactor metagenome]|uniref:Uncharacterized protein n=1 Tax=bioreactor metagenome TaxID=1076179 RepID=A0A645JKK8_9ZZZZ